MLAGLVELIDVLKVEHAHLARFHIIDAGSHGEVVVHKLVQALTLCSGSDGLAHLKHLFLLLLKVERLLGSSLSAKYTNLPGDPGFRRVDGGLRGLLCAVGAVAGQCG